MADPLRWLKLTIAYDGSAYGGWQVQPDQPTIQGSLETAWREITQEEVRLTAAGRTDAGVHALGQVAGVITRSRLRCDVLHRALNAVLPRDIAILSVEQAPAGFHATHDAVGKRYRYQIFNDRVPPIFVRDFCWHYPRPLDADAMQRAGEILVGRHDFASFESTGSERSDTVRTVHEVRVVRSATGDACWGVAAMPASSDSNQGQRIVIDVAGDGFLYNMVRSIVGTLIEVGRGRREIDWVREVLRACDRRRAGQTAPPQGLCLVCVDYAGT